MNRKKRPPRGGGTKGLQYRGCRSDGQILVHPSTYHNAAAAVPTTCRRTLLDLARARREYRDTVSPAMSDAIDNAMESLRVALTIAELEGRDDEHHR